MELPWLFNQIETHAEQLTERVIEAVRTSPETAFLRDVSKEELKRRFFDLYRNLGRWLSEKNDDEIEAIYGEIGRRRCREGVPLNALIYTLMLVKKHLWEYIQRNIVPASEGRLYEEVQVIEMMTRFFDRAVYHTVRGYEESWTKDASLRLLAGAPSEAASATTAIARAILGELEPRRGVLDNDLRLSSVTFTVKLDPPGKVRSVTLLQESYTDERHRR
jgi:histidine kinase-like protein